MSVRFLKPPNPQMATTSSTSASRIEPYTSEDGMVLRPIASEPLGPPGGGHAGSTLAESTLAESAPPEAALPASELAGS
jgi:hypothetical protein